MRWILRGWIVVVSWARGLRGRPAPHLATPSPAPRPAPPPEFPSRAEQATRSRALSAAALAVHRAALIAKSCHDAMCPGHRRHRCHDLTCCRADCGRDS